MVKRQEQNLILNLGCGSQSIPGAINVDLVSRKGVDIIHDLNNIPYPFISNKIDVIYITDTFFLLEDPISIMNELHRILKKNGKLIITNPYFRSKFAFIDPYLKSFYTIHSFDFYDQSTVTAKRYKYSKCSFIIEKIRFNESLENHFFKKFIILLANKFPSKYESLSHLYPLDRITYYLVKQ
jgi:ubiquinone/menaquinone biosynthesis C-methylase UbiE